MSTSSSHRSSIASIPKHKRSMKHYSLLVTAGTTRDHTKQIPVPVNSEEPLKIETDEFVGELYVRVQGFKVGGGHCLFSYGCKHASENWQLRHTNHLGPNDLAATSPYFDHPSHTNDQYSICLSPFRFKNKNIPGDDLVLGNDFDSPVTKPPGFGVAWRIARYLIDPGLDGDPWADKPWIEGRVLSSVNICGTGVRSVDEVAGGEKNEEVVSSTKSDAKVVEETLGSRAKLSTNEVIPTAAKDRMKFFLKKERRDAFSFEKDHDYHLDFFNPYIDFNQFALRLPGITIKVLKYWSGQPLRYVLKNRIDQTVYLIVQFTLVENEHVEGAYSSSGDSIGGTDSDDYMSDDVSEKLKEAEKEDTAGVKTSEDDLD